MKLSRITLFAIAIGTASAGFGVEQQEKAPEPKELGEVSEATYEGLKDLAEDLGGLKYIRSEDNQVMIVTAKEDDGKYKLSVTATGGYATSEEVAQAAAAGDALEEKTAGKPQSDVERCYAADSGIVLAPDIWRDGNGTTWYPNASKQHCSMWYSYSFAARRCTRGSFQRSSYGTLSTDGCKCW